MGNSHNRVTQLFGNDKKGKVKTMCEDGHCCCSKPDEQKNKPEDCAPEQIAKCHPESDEHPCAQKESETDQGD